MTPVDRRRLAVLLATALVLRVTWALLQPNTSAAIDKLPDQREYLELGRNLLHHGSLHLYDPRFDQTVVAYRLPGYPAFIALCGGSVPIVRLAQAVLDTSTVLAVFLIARQLSDSVPGSLTAAALVAVNPFLVYFSGLLLTESLFTAAITWAIYTGIRRALPATATLFIVALFLRPTALILGPFISILAVNCVGRPTYHWRLAVGVTIAMVVSLMPWAWRNHHRLGSAVWTTTNDGITFFDGFHDGATGASDQRFVAAMPGLRSMNELDRSRDLSRQARQWVTDHPKQLPSLSLRKIARGWSPVPLSQDFSRSLYRWVGGGYAVPFDLLCLVGLASRRLRCLQKGTLLAPALVLTAVQVITVGSIRYRVPAEPALAVLAGVGAVELWRRVVERRESRAPGVHPAQGSQLGIPNTNASSGHHTSSPV